MKLLKVYVIFLFWLFWEFFEELLEVGDIFVLKFVFFFDEVYFLFLDVLKELV